MAETSARYLPSRSVGELIDESTVETSYFSGLHSFRIMAYPTGS